MDLLEKLVLTPSVPGRETRIRSVIKQYIEEKKLFDRVEVDPMGSLIGYRDPRPAGKSGSEKPKRVFLAAHMDQIGFLVSHISDSGYLRINAAGGFDNRNLFARTVTVAARDGDLIGVLNPGGRPIHIAADEDKKKIPELKEFYIDLGLPADEVLAKVRIGDMVTLNASMHQIGDYVVSQCLDNRVGCWALIRAIENLENHDCEIVAAWTVQEEVGLRGAMTSAYAASPDIGISCDTTLCCETPGVPNEERVTSAGAGVCLGVMDSSMIADISLIEDIEAVAESSSIDCQRGILPRGGQDGAVIQRSRGGVPCAAFACPIKNIHTVTEMAHKHDLESYHQLLTAWLSSTK